MDIFGKNDIIDTANEIQSYVCISCIFIANNTEVDMELHFSRHIVNRWHVECESINLLHEDLHKGYRHIRAVDSTGG